MSTLGSIARTVRIIPFVALLVSACRPSERTSLVESAPAKTVMGGSSGTASAATPPSESAESISPRTQPHSPSAERYCADRTIGGIDRVSIRKLRGGQCYQLVLAKQPGDSPGLALPRGFGLDRALLIECESGAAITAATTVTGSVEVAGEGPDGLPEQVVNVDVAIHFARDAGLPSEEHLRAQNLTVEGSRCK